MNELLTELSKDPKKKAICSILEKMSVSATPQDCCDELSEAIQAYGGRTICCLILPILVEMSLQSGDLVFLSFITNLKHTATLCDPTRLSLQEIKNYLNALEKMSKRFSDQMAPMAGMDADSAFLIVNCGHILSTFTKDAFAFWRYGKFAQPFKVKCPHCGVDAQLSLAEDKITHMEELRPSGSNLRMLWRMRAFINLGLEDYAKQLWYLYGSYQCDSCQETSAPIDAAAYYVAQEECAESASIEHIERMVEVLLEDPDETQENWFGQVFFYGNYLAELMWEVEGADSLRPYTMLLKISIMIHEYYGEEYLHQVVNFAIVALEESQEENLDIKGDVCFWIGQALSHNQSASQEQKREAMQYLQKAEQYFATLYGTTEKEKE